MAARGGLGRPPISSLKEGGSIIPTVTVNGAEIYYEEVGSGTPIILSPGGLQRRLDVYQSGRLHRESEVYQSVMEGLASNHRVIAYDRRFGGRSSSPLVVQTWDLVCQDVIGLMDSLGIEQASLGGGAFGAAISLRCAACYPDRVRAIFPSNLNGGLICTSYFVVALYKSLHMARNQGIGAVVDGFREIEDDRFAPFVPERATYDPEYRKALEDMGPEDFAQVMRDTIYALFDGNYVCLGMTEELLKSIRTPTLIIHGIGDDIQPRSMAEQVHRLVPNSQWADMPPHFTVPERYVQRVLQFLAEVEANS